MPAPSGPDLEAQPASKHYNTAERKHSAVVERGQTLFPVLSAVGTFGASLALASFYAARQLSDDATTLAFLSWAYTAYAVATVTTLVWQLALLSDIWVAARRTRFFRSERGVLLALGLSILSIAAGTVLVSLALRQPASTPGGVVVSAFTATAAIALIIGFTFLRFIFVWTTTEREKPFLILPFNNCIKKRRGESKDKDLEDIKDFLSMYSQHGERLATINDSRPDLADRKIAKILHYAGLAMQYEVRDRPDADHLESEEEIETLVRFIKKTRTWKDAVELLNAFDKGHFYTRPLKEQAWRFQLLLKTLPVANSAATTVNSGD